MSARYTVFDTTTLQVFGRGLTQEEAYQCAINNVLVRDRETEAEWRRDDPGSDMMLLRTTPLAVIADDGFERLAQADARGIEPR
jgi:hypothetical protein